MTVVMMMGTIQINNNNKWQRKNRNLLLCLLQFQSHVHFFQRQRRDHVVVHHVQYQDLVAYLGEDQEEDQEEGQEEGQEECQEEGQEEDQEENQEEDQD